MTLLDHRPRRGQRPALALATLGLTVCSGVTAGATTSPPPTTPVVVAVTGETTGVNVLHQDFRTRDGRTPRYPTGMPHPVMISLPRAGGFSSQRAALEAGPLGRMKTGVLYGIAGTRLLLVNAGTDRYDGVQADALHATGVADSVTGTQYGTDPSALVVVVLSNLESGYPWLAANASWVDLASTSSYTVSTVNGTGGDTTATRQCTGAAEVRSFTAAGHLLLSSSGNTTDQPEPLIAPNGLPDTYLVGGVDAGGNTWRPGHAEESEPFYAAGNVVRPYETGEQFSYRAAAPDSVTGSTHFGGTSGATPRTAGWAARLVAHARADLRSSTGTTGGALAVGSRRTARGPLADGRFTKDELVNLLHVVALQHSGLPAGAAYAAEGYGALDAVSIRRAEAILDGTEPLPTRASDDQANAAAHQVRTALFARCT
jgi:hypothetical protein